jgi:pimeloyl-ACP methyl ester carboxylesterase
MTGIKHHRVWLREVNMHYVTAGDAAAEPLLLVHGFPKSWFEWRHMIPLLAQNYRVIAPDLRGAGDSSKPSGGFDKKTMAKDLVDLIDALGIAGNVHVVGRDWGAPTALALALHWKRAKSLTYIDNLVPGFGFEEAIQPIPPNEGEDPVFQACGINHFTFHLMPDVAEFLIAGREQAYFDWFLKRLAYNVGAIDDETVAECVRCMSQPGALRATLAWSRALYQDGRDNREAIAQGKLTIPVLALGAEHSAGSRTEQSMRLVAENVSAGLIPDCGHWASEEQPEWLADRILRFLADRH